MKFLALLLLACAAAPALANRSLLGGCAGGSVCLLAKETGGSTQCPPLPTGELRFCDARCNAGSGNSGACNTCPVGFNTPGSANYVGDKYACKTSTNSAGQVVNPYTACSTATCGYMPANTKNPGYYFCQWIKMPDGSQCDDSDLATEGDVCVAGECVGTLKDCPATAPSGCFVDGTGKPDATGTCVYDPVVCNSPPACYTGTGTCAAGVCTYTAALPDATDCGACSECYAGACVNFSKDVGGASKCFKSDACA